jgi:hypothetical protein
MAAVFLGLVFNKAATLFVSALALLSVIGGFYFAPSLIPQRSSETEAVETRRSGQPLTKQEKSKFDVSEKREPLTDDRGQTKLEAPEAERESELISARYKLCISMAEKNFAATWAANCKSISEQDKKRHKRCIAQVDTKVVCAPLARAFSERCALPVELASRLNKELEDLKTRCRPVSGPASAP